MRSRVRLPAGMPRPRAQHVRTLPLRATPSRMLRVIAFQAGCRGFESRRINAIRSSVVERHSLDKQHARLQIAGSLDRRLRVIGPQRFKSATEATPCASRTAPRPGHD